MECAVRKTALMRLNGSITEDYRSREPDESEPLQLDHLQAEFSTTASQPDKAIEDNSARLVVIPED